MPVQIDTKRTF